jgi:CheY-like chemotaxis protein
MQWIEGQVGIEFTTKTSTAEAIQELEANPDRYALVISDMSRPGDRRAGYTLLQEMTKRGIQTPLAIYSASGRAEYDEEARALGALGSTNSPTRLLELISQVVQSKASDKA